MASLVTKDPLVFEILSDEPSVIEILTNGNDDNDSLDDMDEVKEPAKKKKKRENKTLTVKPLLPPEIDMSEYGTSTYEVGSAFQDYETISHFIQDIHFNKGKQLTYVKGGNNYYKTWKCDFCPCKVVLQNRVGKKETKLKDVPTNNWYISKIIDHVMNCQCKSFCFARQVKKLKGFSAPIIENHGINFERVANCIAETDQLDLFHRPGTIYKALKELKREKELTNCDEYALLKSYIERYQFLNKDCYSVLQLDNMGRFYRAFLVNPVMINNQDLLLTYGVDSCHMQRNSEYNGKQTQLIGRDGNRKNQLLAIMIHPNETIEDWVWFFSNCLLAGIKLTEKSIQSDRGHQRGAQAALENCGVTLSLKFCVYHITTNILHKFRSLNLQQATVLKHVVRFQTSETILAYQDAVKKMAEAFPNPILKKNSAGQVVSEEFVHEYMFKIHPTCYSVFGNKVLTEQEELFINTNWGNEKSYGRPMPLFGWNASTGNEGEHSAMRTDGSRHCGPLTILEKWMLRSNARTTEMVHKCKVLRMRGCNLFEWPTKQFNRQRGMVVHYRVLKTPEDHYFHVQQRANSTHPNTFDVYSVNLNTGECSGCTARQQLHCACRHLLAVVNHLANTDEKHPFLQASDYCIENFFHPAFIVEDVQHGLKDEILRIPNRSNLGVDTIILPSPTYKNGTVKKNKKNRGLVTSQHPPIASKAMVSNFVGNPRWILVTIMVMMIQKIFLL